MSSLLTDIRIFEFPCIKSEDSDEGDAYSRSNSGSVSCSVSFLYELQLLRTHRSFV